MSASIPRLVARDPTEHIVAGLREHGAVIVEGVLAPDLLTRFNAEIDPILEHVSAARSYLNPAIDYFYGDRVRQITGVAARSRIFGEEILSHPFYADICDAILGPNCSRYQLNVAQVMDRGPGAEQQLLHRDEDVWVHLPRPHAEVQLASVIALVDFSAELGATVVAPGSHRWERGREPKPEELASAEMPAGSAVVYLGSTIHAGGRNATAGCWRRGMHMSFVVGWLRTEDNNYLSTPPDIARALPRRSQELLGYAAHDLLAKPLYEDGAGRRPARSAPLPDTSCPGAPAQGLPQGFSLAPSPLQNPAFWNGLTATSRRVPKKVLGMC